MKCMTCGSSLQPDRSDLPFKVSEHSIVILKDLPVLQCDNCGEYSIEDPGYRREDEILGEVNASAGLPEHLRSGQKPTDASTKRLVPAEAPTRFAAFYLFDRAALRSLLLPGSGPRIAWLRHWRNWLEF